MAYMIEPLVPRRERGHVLLASHPRKPVPGTRSHFQHGHIAPALVGLAALAKSCLPHPDPPSVLPPRSRPAPPALPALVCVLGDERQEEEAILEDQLHLISIWEGTVGS